MVIDVLMKVCFVEVVIGKEQLALEDAAFLELFEDCFQVFSVLGVLVEYFTSEDVV